MATTTKDAVSRPVHKPGLDNRLGSVLGNGPKRVEPISRNYGFSLYQVETGNARYAVKTGKGEVPGHLAIEARMLRDLARDGSLTVPQVFHDEDDLLVLEWIENDGGPLRRCHERAAGEALAQLHSTPQGCFGYSYDTTIGGLAQTNGRHASWVEFFRDSRVLGFAHEAHRRCSITAGLLARLERLAARLNELLPEPASPALVHGDAWFGNVLTNGDAIAAYIDPALYYGSPEIELAYVTMHGTFGKSFFEAYAANAAIEPGFMDHRVDILNIYPNLVHVMLCGPAYIAPITRTLERLGL